MISFACNAVRLETSDRSVEPTSPRGLESLISSPAQSVCACSTQTSLFLFGFLQAAGITFPVEDLVWSVASATAVPHSFLFLLRHSLKRVKPGTGIHTRGEEVLLDRKANKLHRDGHVRTHFIALAGVWCRDLSK
ncbi:unnamed protein product [Pleuronectes platessa]|uniref:Uncharacterized protein n=1 Tax=Pleuronectes platessa TaxID=8262 RepID=A0A9N7VKZ3_PLEPL|nr:unnamed protein product [Pleuronectes platessa]